MALAGEIAPKDSPVFVSKPSEGVPNSIIWNGDLEYSSGEEASRHLQQRDDAFHAALGRVCYHIGPARDGVE
jgi:hypothetical protein